jgi:hypothetical protein
LRSGSFRKNFGRGLAAPSLRRGSQPGELSALTLRLTLIVLILLTSLTTPIAVLLIAVDVLLLPRLLGLIDLTVALVLLTALVGLPVGLVWLLGLIRLTIALVLLAALVRLVCHLAFPPSIKGPATYHIIIKGRALILQKFRLSREK